MELIYKEITTEQKFHKKMQNFYDGTLKIVDIPSTSHAKRLLLERWFTKIHPPSALKFIITDAIQDKDRLKPALIPACKGNILITFESLVSMDCYFFWKLDGLDEKVYSLKVDKKFAAFIWDFLTLCFGKKSNGEICTFIKSFKT